MVISLNIIPITIPVLIIFLWCLQQTPRDIAVHVAKECLAFMMVVMEIDNCVQTLILVISAVADLGGVGGCK